VATDPGIERARRGRRRAFYDERIVVAKREMRGRGLWGLVLGAAQRACTLPEKLFIVNTMTRPARSELWHELIEAGVSAEDIARWWSDRPTRVEELVARFSNPFAKKTRLPVMDPERPHYEPGTGGRVHDCANEAICLDGVPWTYGHQMQCPNGCKFYTRVTKRATDYLRQKDGPSVPAQATGTFAR